MRSKWVLAVLLALAVPATAQAAPAPIDCVLDKLDPATRSAIAADVRANLEQQGEQSYSEASRTPITNASTQCANALGWDENRRTAAAKYALVRVAVDIVRAALTVRGIDPDRVVRGYQVVPPQRRRAELGKEDYEFVASVLVANGTLKNAADGYLVGNYLGMLNLIDVSEAAFAVP